MVILVYFNRMQTFLPFFKFYFYLMQMVIV